MSNSIQNTQKLQKGVKENKEKNIVKIDSKKELNQTHVFLGFFLLISNRE